MSAYTDVSTEQIRAWLAEALNSRHQQMIGPSSASGDDGRRVAFERAKRDLDAHITELRNEISRREGGAAASGPITIGF